MIYFKYSSFLEENINFLKGFGFNGLLPLGISFYTFQQIAFLVDSYKFGTQEKSIKKYTFFVSFFPQLISGPIVHHRQIFEQLKGLPTFRYTSGGLTYFAIGLIKKICLAAPLGRIVDYEYGLQHGDMIRTSFAILAYGFQIYFDFSAYSDMARGLGKFVGIDIPKNFISPYKATSLSDFWKRWHITLSEFLRDYIYIPLGGNRKGNLRLHINLILTMFIGGIWHGAGFQYMIWGLGHGVLLVTERLIKNTPFYIRSQFIQRFLVVSSVFLLWIPFRMESVEKTIRILNYLIIWDSKSLPKIQDYYLVYISAFISFCLPNSHQIIESKYFNNNASFKNIKQYISKKMHGNKIYICAIFAHILIFITSYQFYTHEIDKTIYQHISFDQSSSEVISTSKNSLRANAYIHEIYKGQDKKIVFVGPSYMTNFPVKRIKIKEKIYKFGSMAFNGQYFSSVVRGAYFAKEAKHVETIVLGLNPLLAYNDLYQSGPFQYEGVEFLEDFSGEKFKHNPLSKMSSTHIGLSEALYMFFNLSQKRYYQTHHFYDNIIFRSQLLHHKYPLENFNEYFKNQKIKLEKFPNFTITPHNRTYGWERAFEKRKIFEKDGHLFKFLKKFKDLTLKWGMNLVIINYPMPQLSPEKEGFPINFRKKFRHSVESFCEELEIKCFDYSHIYPYDEWHFSDFSHLTIPARKKLMNQFIQDYFKE